MHNMVQNTRHLRVRDSTKPICKVKHVIVTRAGRVGRVMAQERIPSKDVHTLIVSPWRQQLRPNQPAHVHGGIVVEGENVCATTQTMLNDKRGKGAKGEENTKNLAELWYCASM
jgi:hypothetical protein